MIPLPGFLVKLGIPEFSGHGKRHKIAEILVLASQFHEIPEVLTGFAPLIPVSGKPGW